MELGTKSITSISVCALVLATQGVSQTSHGSNDQVLAVEAKWVNAIRSANAVALNNLLSEELFYVHSNGAVVTKRELIRSLKPDIEEIEYSDTKVRVFGSAAVVTTQARIRGASADESYENRVRITHV